MNKFLFLLIVSLITIQLSAQKIQLRGRVLSGKSSVEYANVLLQNKDSVFVTGGVTDQNGRFAFNNLDAGDYRLRISNLGYTTKYIALNSMASSQELNDIQLDSTSVAMDEVVVKGSCIINMNDRKIFFPTAQQIKASSNGMDMLQRMKLNRLQINPINNSITSSKSGEVQTRINGAKVEQHEIRALRPEDVQRIEYHEDPSLRYGNNVAVVIDYITKVRQSGGYVGVDAQNSPYETFGNNGLNGKINYKNSEWGVNYWGLYRGFDGYWRDNEEIFNFNGDKKITRKEAGAPGNLTENHHYLTLSYSLRQGEKWSFVSRLRGSYNSSGMFTHSYLYPIDRYDDGVNMSDDSNNRYTSPSIDFYFQRNYPKKQTLILNAVGTYIHSKDRRDYIENQEGKDLTDIKSRINGDKYSFIGEGIYEKEFKVGKFGTGFNLYHQLSNSKYSGSYSSNNYLHATYLNFYGEWSGKIKKFNYRVSTGGVQARYSQANKVINKLLYTSRIRIGYKFSDNLNLSCDGSLNYNTPEIGDISDVKQIIDSLQIRKGNPDLRESDNYNMNMILDYNKGLFSASLNTSYNYQNRPIMESIYYKDNKFVHIMENQRNWQKLSNELEVKVGPIKNIFNVSLSTGVDMFNSKGLDYNHKYTNWYYRVVLWAMYKNFSTTFQMQNHRNNFYGEALNYGESLHILFINYKIKNFTVGIMALNPFTTKDSYRRPSETRNKYLTSHSCLYLRGISPLYVANISWNFSFGRKFKSVEKRLNSEDTKTGNMKTGK